MSLVFILSYIAPTIISLIYVTFLTIGDIKEIKRVGGEILYSDILVKIVLIICPIVNLGTATLGIVHVVSNITEYLYS